MPLDDDLETVVVLFTHLSVIVSLAAHVPLNVKPIAEGDISICVLFMYHTVPLYFKTNVLVRPVLVFGYEVLQSLSERAGINSYTPFSRIASLAVAISIVYGADTIDEFSYPETSAENMYEPELSIVTVDIEVDVSVCEDAIPIVPPSRTLINSISLISTITLFL